VLLRDHRYTASAEAFFRRAIVRADLVPEEVLTDHHQPWTEADRDPVALSGGL